MLAKHGVRSKVLILTVEKKMANYHLPPPEPMVCTGDVVTNWRIFKEAFADYSTATELAKKYAEVQAATLKMVMEKSADKYFRVWSSLKPKRKTRLQFWTSYRSILHPLGTFYMNDTSFTLRNNRQTKVSINI